MEQGAIRQIRLGAMGLAFTAALFCFGLMLWSGNPGNPWWWLGAVFFMVWVFAPYSLLWLAARRPLKKMGAAIGLLIGCVVTVAFGIAIYTQSFLLDPHPDAQVGLLFLFIPPWQVLAAAATWATMLWLERRR